MALIKLENFDGVTPPALPSGWVAGSGHTTTAIASQSSPNSLLLKIQDSYMFYNTVDGNGGNCSVEVDFSHGSENIGVPCLWIFIRRSSNAYSNTGVNEYNLKINNGSPGSDGVTLNKRVSGTLTAIVTLSLANTVFVAGQWYKAYLEGDGSSIKARVTRISDGYSLNSSGAWQSGSTFVISATNSEVTGSGYSGLRGNSAITGANSLYLDNWKFQTITGSGLVAGNSAITTAADNTTVGITCTGASGGTAPYTSQWYRNGTTGFTPGPSNLISGATNLTINDTGLTPNTNYYYRAVMTDSVSATSASNEVHVLTTNIADSITLTSPKNYTIFQRCSTTGMGTINVFGTYTGTPSSIEYSFNGSAFSSLILNPAGGTFAANLTSQSGYGQFVVRFSNATSITATSNPIGIGDNFVIAGQSNGSGRGTNLRSYFNDNVFSSLFGNDYTWKALVDPTDSITGQIDSISQETATPGGSVWPGVATRLVGILGYPIGFIPCAKGGTSITQWQPGSNHLSRTTLYGSMNYRAQQVGCKAVLFWLGETDANNAMDQATFTSGLNSLADSVNADLGVKLIPCTIERLSALASENQKLYQAGIAAAVDDVWGNNVNVIRGPDLYNLITADSSDGQHLNNDSNVIDASRYWAISLLKNLYLF